MLQQQQQQRYDNDLKQSAKYCLLLGGGLSKQKKTLNKSKTTESCVIKTNKK